MFTSKQRSYLRSLSNTIKPIFQVGKGGLNDNMIKQIVDALEARELIKISVLKNAEDSAKEMCEEIAMRSGAQVVQVIGNRITLYKESIENKVIELP